MNLIEQPWLPVRRRNGEHSWISPWQITEMDNPVVELVAPRADFQGALYQWLLGLLQTTVMPEDAEHWETLYDEPPSPATLQQAFAPLSPAMVLHNPDGPAFLQDFDLADGEIKPIAGLLIEAPGAKTIKDNLDHFIKRDTVTGLCHSCTATALFTLQANAPSGGSGHRVSLRGGGPLTTLICPLDNDATLWQKLWLNVLEHPRYRTDNPISARVLPWMGPTRTSDKTGRETGPEDAHPLQMFWGMPRRIRLLPATTQGCCSLCGAEDQPLVEQYRTRNYGTNYSDGWRHPLTPYRDDPKKLKPSFSLKAQPGGLGYRHWIGLALASATNGDSPAAVVTLFNESRVKSLLGFGERRQRARLWCFGFDMDNMKARCWYDHQFPLFSCTPAHREWLLDRCSLLMEVAQLALSTLRSHVREAWANRPKDLKGDTSYIDDEFWQLTQQRFFSCVQQLSQQVKVDDIAPLMNDWLRHVQHSQQQCFDRWTLESAPQDLPLKRIINARAAMGRKFNLSKLIKDYRTRYPAAAQTTLTEEAGG